MSDKEENSDKLGWMYRDSNDTVDREEYLLGRRLDKNVDSQSNATTSDSIPSSIFSLPECTNRIDLLRKIKEDPLEAIKEKERAMRKEILKNPIQMKKLKKMFEAQREKDERSQQHEMRKKVKKQKKSSDCNDKELDALLSQKLAKLIKKYGKDKIFNSDDKDENLKCGSSKKSKYVTSSSSSCSSSAESSDNDDDRLRKRKEPIRDKKRVKEKPERRERRSKRSSSSENSSKDSDDERKIKSIRFRENSSKDGDVRSFNDNFDVRDSKKYISDHTPPREKPFGLYVPEGAKKVKNEDTSKRRKAQSPPRRPRDRSRDEKGHGSRDGKHFRRESSGDGDQIRRNTRDRDLSRRDSRKPDSDRYYQRKGGRDRDNHNNSSSSMSQQEKQRKLKEMMDNASWRKDLMESNTKIHKEQLKKEEKQQEKYDENFAKNELSKGIYSDTVEKRIKSNIQNIQRSKFDMDKNFARR